MSKALDKSHPLFINLFISVLPLSSANGTFLGGSQFHFCLFISFHQPAAVFVCRQFTNHLFRRFVLLESDSLPCRRIIEQKQECFEKTWRMETLSCLTLKISIMQAIDCSGVYTFPRRTRPPGHHTSRRAASVRWHAMSSWWETMLSSVCQKDSYNPWCR